jgi:hypothetical protein
MFCFGAAALGPATVLPGQGPIGNARFVALISPLRDEILQVLTLAEQTNAFSDFGNCPSTPVWWDAKIACGKVEVNLWKNLRVSYVLTHSNGT